jgi:hypothetical protein
MSNVDRTVLTHLTAALDKLDELNENSGTTFEGTVSVFDLNGNEKKFDVKSDDNDGSHYVVI